MISIAIVGATGLVGRELIKLLENFSTPFSLRLFASIKSDGREISFRGGKLTVEKYDLSKTCDIDYLFFCAGKAISSCFIPMTRGVCIDLSSAFRNNLAIPLIIPEINLNALKAHRVIASPNCTTTIMLMALYPLHRAFKIKRIAAATYQAMSGGGYKLLEELNSGKKALYLHDSPQNALGYSEEEVKMVNETQKILEDPTIKITACCVRVPTPRVHSMALNVEFHLPPTLSAARQLLEASPCLLVETDHLFTTEIAEGQHKTFIGRLRYDMTQSNTLDLWAMGDQLLKGAALNAFQILESVIERDSPVTGCINSI